MSNASRVALANRDIVDNVLEHVYSAERDDDEVSPLCAASLVARTWTRAAQALLHRRLVFKRGSHQLVSWLESVGGGSEPSEYESIEVLFECARPFDEGLDDYNLIGQVLHKVVGVKSLVIAFMGQHALPAELFLAKNFVKTLKALVLCSPLVAGDFVIPLGSLEKLAVYDQYPELSRDWSETFKLIARCILFSNSPLRKLAIELVRLENHLRYLVPDLPLAQDPRSIRGSLLPIASHIRFLTLPDLLPSQDIHNLAIFAVACTSLETLKIGSVTSFSTSTIPILRFFPALRTLHIVELVGLPCAPTLHPDHRLRLYVEGGRGDPILAISALLTPARDGPAPSPLLNSIVIERRKFFYDQHQTMLIDAFLSKGGGGGQLAWGQDCELTREEIMDANAIFAETVRLTRLDEKTQPIAQELRQVEAQIQEITEAVLGQV